MLTARALLQAPLPDVLTADMRSSSRSSRGYDGGDALRLEQWDGFDDAVVRFMEDNKQRLLDWKLPPSCADFFEPGQSMPALIATRNGVLLAHHTTMH